MSGLVKILIAIFGGAVIGFVAYIVASLFHDLYDLTKPKTASKRNFLTADTVRRIGLSALQGEQAERRHDPQGVDGRLH